jgi:uncharacterized protein YjlB
VSGGAFILVGRYPRGGGWDVYYGREGEEKKVERIAGLTWVARDAIFGDGGPVLEC